MMDLQDAIQYRRAVRDYFERVVDQSTIQTLIRSASLAGTPKGAGDSLLEMRQGHR